MLPLGRRVPVDDPRETWRSPNAKTLRRRICRGERKRLLLLRLSPLQAQPEMFICLCEPYLHHLLQGERKTRRQPSGKDRGGLVFPPGQRSPCSEFGVSKVLGPRAIAETEAAKQEAGQGTNQAKKSGTGDPLHTQEPVTVASFRTWRGWREGVARDRCLTAFDSNIVSSSVFSRRWSANPLSFRTGCSQ